MYMYDIYTHIYYVYSSIYAYICVYISALQITAGQQPWINEY